MEPVLLHACCGPCASACVPALRARGLEPVLLFANSNIDTPGEFERRRAAAARLAEAEGVGFASLPYDHADWLRAVAEGFEDEPERGARCARCFRYNLARTAAFAQANGFASYTTSLTVSPHKPNALVFGAAPKDGPARFLEIAFKEKGGFQRSVRRAAELGLYRQDYCGCEFSRFRWNIHELKVTDSTNRDARAGRPGDVFSAEEQTAGRGRLDHKWQSQPGENVTMSVVLSVADRPPEEVATLPLVMGLAVAKALPAGLAGRVKWPNDVYVNGRKIAGLLCERNGDAVIVGIGLNVRQRVWPPELAARATSLALETGRAPSVRAVRGAVLDQVRKWHGIWRRRGFEAVRPFLAEADFLKGRTVAVYQTDGDAAPLRGVCGGICANGALDVGGTPVYAGEVRFDAGADVAGRARRADLYTDG